MEEVISVLSPPDIKKDVFEKVIDNIREQLSGTMDSEKIRNMLNGYENTPYYFKRDGTYLENKKCTPSIRDAAKFYVLIKYIEYYQSKNSSEVADKAFDAAGYYREFFTDNWDSEKEFIYDYICTEPKRSDLFCDIKIDVVSGSIYKIKKYFLENSRVKDIRGGSALIKYVNEDVTLDYLKNYYSEECAVYCGGGNVLIIAPGGKGKEICMELEQKYSEITLTAQNAFEYIQTNLNEFIRNYKNIMKDLNLKLDERKKLKVYDINPDSGKELIEIDKETIEFDVEGEINERGVVCFLCGVRDAKYTVFIPDIGKAAACPSCFRKHKVGEKKTIFYDEYREFTGKTVKKKVNSIIELGDDNGNIAVIYADGNNMGNVVKNIETPFQHMYFSRTLDRITKECVYKSIYEIMRDEAMFEAIALGGDDIFIIVPGNMGLEIANKIIKKFDRAFKNKMTMSAGICIAKSDTPIKTMFEVAHNMLKNAKKYFRKNNCNEGTLDIQFIRSNIGVNMLESDSSLFPAVNSELSSYLDIVKKIKKDKNIKNSQLYKFSNAWCLMKNPVEFQLFYLYKISRLTTRYNNYMMEFLKSIKNLSENPYQNCGLLPKRSGAVFSARTGFVCLWDDIILLTDAVGGE